MLESKRLPREMKTSLRQDSPALETKSECLRLMNLVGGLKDTLRKTSKKRAVCLREANSLTAEAKRLAEKSLFWTKLKFAFDAIGLVTTGGTATEARYAVEQAIDAVFSVVGIMTSEERIVRKLREAVAKMEQFDDFGNQLDYYERKLAEVYAKLKELGCPTLFAR